MRRWMIGGAAVVVVVAAVAAVVVLGGATGAGPGATATPLPPVPPADQVVAEARVVPARSATLASGVAGQVAAIRVAEGDRVPAGATLLTLDDAAATAQVRAARAALDAATAQREQAVAAETQTAAEVDRATEAWRAARAVQDQLPSNASSARKRQATAEVNGAQAGIDAAKAAQSGAAAATDAAEAGVAQAQAGLDSAEAALAALTITTPIAGVVADVTVSPGDVVSPGMVLVRVAGDGGWSFETTDLTQDEVAAIAVGADASISLDGFSGTVIRGRVAAIAAYGEDRQGDIVFRAVVEPSGDIPAGIRWGMLASIEIATSGP